jgi:pyocin large subunit-like protein
MLSRTVVSLSRRAAVPAFASSASRSVTTVAEAATADDALKFSGYQQIDFKIKDTASVYEAVQKLAAFNIGCLVTTDEAGTTDRQESSGMSRARVPQD